MESPLQRDQHCGWRDARTDIAGCFNSLDLTPRASLFRSPPVILTHLFLHSEDQPHELTDRG